MTFIIRAFGGVMVSKLDLQTYTSEFESHWAPLSYGLVPHLSKKKLSKLPIKQITHMAKYLSKFEFSLLTHYMGFCYTSNQIA